MKNNEQENLSSKAYAFIKAGIMNGTIPSGSVVSEIALAKEIGISRTPVREAIRQLSHEGILNQIPRFGTVVKEVNLRDIVEISELREALEPYAVAKCVENVTDIQLNLLAELCDEIAGFITKLEQMGQECLDEKDSKRFLAIDLGFHMIIINTAGNAKIRDILINARTMARLFIEMHDINVNKLKNTYTHHTAIYNAIKDRDADKARNAMLEHLRVSKQPALMQYHSYQILHGLNSKSTNAGEYTLENVLSQCGLNELVNEPA